jgi:hypothetical protein
MRRWTQHRTRVQITGRRSLAQAQAIEQYPQNDDRVEVRLELRLAAPHIPGPIGRLRAQHELIAGHPIWGSCDLSSVLLGTLANGAKHQVLREREG